MALGRLQSGARLITGGRRIKIIDLSALIGLSQYENNKIEELQAVYAINTYEISVNKGLLEMVTARKLVKLAENRYISGNTCHDLN